MSKTDNQEIEKMERYTFRLPPSLLQKARKRAGLVPVSRIIRVLLEKWLSGEIEIDHAEET